MRLSKEDTEEEAPALPGTPVSPKRWALQDWAAAAILFLGTAAIVLWQNSRLAILWDLSYILENSYRISLGQVPYRDFPFPYAPGTFLIQALVIRLTGRVFFHHVVYCAVMGGAGTVLTWQILLRTLRGAFRWSRLTAFLLALPLTVLGIYCIFPHPFYDADCTFAILCAAFLLLRLESTETAPLFHLIAGALCVAPLFVKQNTGLAFLTACAVSAVLLLAFEAGLHGKHVGRYAWLLAGIGAGLGIAVLLLHFSVGLDNYVHWTLAFASSRRLPHVSEMVAPFENSLLPVWFAAFAVGAFLARRNSRRNQWRAALAVALMAAPFVWAVLYLFVDAEVSEHAERLLSLWPFVLILSLAFAVRGLIRKGPSIARLLPLILIATVVGAFLSQQLWGSTYAIWPLLIILFASVLVEVREFIGEPASGELKWLAPVVAACLLIAGGLYVVTHERLNYADTSTGELARSSLTAVTGLSMRGRWIPDFEELVRFTDRAVPRNEGLLMVPGEDLFYYTTGRRPQFPVLMFDRTVNPYSAEEIVKIARQQRICWLVVKKQLQLNEEPVEGKEHLLGLLRAEFIRFQELSNYEIYRRERCGDGSR